MTYLFPAIFISKKTDSLFPGEDLLCQRHEINHSGSLNGWMWWKNIPSSILPAPWAISMVCAVRVSGNLLSEVSLFAEANKRSFKFIEFIFNTLAMRKGLKVKALDSLQGIVARKNWVAAEMSIDSLYHPVKDANLRNKYRAYFDTLIN